MAFRRWREDLVERNPYEIVGLAGDAKRYVRQSGDRQTTSFCLGSFRDAFWLRRNRPPDAQPWLCLKSPAQCLGFLGLVAAACVLLALRYHRPDMPLAPIGQPILAMLYMAVMSLPALPATTSLRLGEYPANRNGWRWVFFAGKIALVLPSVFFGVLGLASMAGLKIHAGPIHCMLVGYVIAFR